MDKTARLAELERNARAIRKLQWNASQMRNAPQVGRLEKELVRVYNEIDNLRRNTRYA